MADRFPLRVATAMKDAKSVGCRAAPIWFDDLEAMADRADTADSIAYLFNSVCHDAMHVIVSMARTLDIYAPAEGAVFRKDADEIFKRWAEVRATLANQFIAGLDLADGFGETIFFMQTPEGIRRIDPKDFYKLAEEAQHHG